MMANRGTKKAFTDFDVERLVGNLLRYGVIISCVVTTIGGIIYSIQRQGVRPDYTPTPDGVPFAGVDESLRSLSTIIPRMLDGDGAAIIQFGVCVLIATPILRVLMSLISFLIEKDYMYVAISFLVLSIILANMLLGIH